MTKTEALAAKGAPVTIVGGPYGIAPRDELTGPGVTRFRDDEVARDGEPAVYVGPHPTVEGWHLVHTGTRLDGTELLAPLSAGMFEVAPPAPGEEG